MIHQDSLTEDFYLAVPLQKGQLSCREVMNGERLNLTVPQDSPIMIEVIDSPYSRIDSLKQDMYKRGL